MEKREKSRNILYPLITIGLVFLFLFFLTFRENFYDWRLIGALLIFLTLLLFSFFKTAKVFLLMIFFLPVFIGMDRYQLSITPLFSNFSSVDVSINIFSLACIFIISLGIIELLRAGREVFKTPLIIIIPIALILNTVSLIGSGYLIKGLVFEIYFIAPFAAYFLGFRLLNSEKKYLRLIFTVIMSAFIPIIVSLKQILSGQFLFEADLALPRLQGTFPHSNTFGSFLFIVATVYLIAYLSLRFSEKEKAGKKYWLIPFLFLIILLILTYSRTALMGIFIAVIILALVKVNFRKPAFWGGTSLFVLLLLFEKTRERIRGIFKRELFDSLWGRFEIWDLALFEFRKNRLSGFGIGSFEEVIKDARGKETGNVYPHNDGIRFLLEGGLLGFLGYLLYMLGAIFYAAKSYWKYSLKEHRGRFFKKRIFIRTRLLGICSLILFIVMGITSLVEAPSMDFTYQMFAWTILGSWLGTAKKAHKI